MNEETKAMATEISNAINILKMLNKDKRERAETLLNLISSVKSRITELETELDLSRKKMLTREIELSNLIWEEVKDE